MTYQQQLLPLARLGSAWIWLLAFIITVSWSNRSYGPRAMALAAWLFALSPNLLAHGALATMELPLVAGTTAMFWLFWRFLETNRPLWFWASAASWADWRFRASSPRFWFPRSWRWSGGSRAGKGESDRLSALTQRVALPMTGFLLIMLLSTLL